MNSQQRAAMQMALEALEMIATHDPNDGQCDNGYSPKGVIENTQAITALREALEASSGGSESSSGGMAQPQNHSGEATDMVQGKWVDLTDDEILAIAIQYDAEEGISDVEYGNRVLKAFKEKNTPPVMPQGEPVAWMRDNEDCTDCFVWERDEEHTIPLYITPPSSQRADALVEAAIEATKEKAAKLVQGSWTAGINMRVSMEAAHNLAAAIRGMK